MVETFSINLLFANCLVRCVRTVKWCHFLLFVLGTLYTLYLFPTHNRSIHSIEMAAWNCVHTNCNRGGFFRSLCETIYRKGILWVKRFGLCNIFRRVYVYSRSVRAKGVRKTLFWDKTTQQIEIQFPVKETEFVLCCQAHFVTVRLLLWNV